MLGAIFEHAVIIVWVLGAIGGLFWLEIPQKIYYFFKSRNNPDPPEVEFVDSDEEDGN